MRIYKATLEESMDAYQSGWIIYENSSIKDRQTDGEHLNPFDADTPLEHDLRQKWFHGWQDNQWAEEWSRRDEIRKPRLSERKRI